MAEEIRRSGRANKGHHTKNQDAMDEPAPAPAASKAKAKGKADKTTKADKPTKADKKAPSHSVEPEDEPDDDNEEGDDDEEEENAVIRCVCGDQRDILGRQMICCDQCEVWQHNKCLGLPAGDDYWENRTYYCEQCRPQDHTDLLAAMARGEKPWARKKGTKQKPRASDVTQDATSEAATTPQPTPAPPTQIAPPAPMQTHPSQDSSAPTNGHAKETSSSQPQSPLGEKRRHESADKETASKKRRKSSQHEKAAAPATDVASLPEKQKALAEKLQEILSPLISAASDARGFRIPDGQTPTSLAGRFALQISQAALEQYGEPSTADSPYTTRLRAILFNVKKNAILIDRLLSGSLKADELVTMAPEEMASEDKQREYAAMREAAEKQMILTEEAGPRMRKTHKGEELVDDENANNNTEFRQPHLRERESMSEDQPQRSPAEVSQSPAEARPLSVDTSGHSDTRRPSTNFDINSVFNKVRSPQHDQQTFMPRRQSSMRGQDKPHEVDDADVDRLLKDEDNDVAMSGVSSDPTVCWHGSINMQSMEPFDAVARHVAGGDFGQVVPWDKLLTSSISIQGRIEHGKGDEYIRGIGTSESHDVAVLSISPVTSEGRAVLDHLYNYFHSRGRWGVVPVDSTNHVMRDLYVIPLEAGGSNLPPFIDMLEYCTVETPRKDNMLLLALIAKLPEARPAPSAAAQPQTQVAPFPPAATAAATAAPPHNGPSPSPVSHHANPQGPQFSPMASSFPSYGNPYAAHPTAPLPPGGHISPHAPHLSPHSLPPQLPPQQAPQQHAPVLPSAGAPAHHYIPKALEILGPYIDSPVISQMLNSNSFSETPAVAEMQMQNLRHIVEQVPEARTNLSVLVEHMATKGQGS